MSIPFARSPGISGIFGRLESAPELAQEFKNSPPLANYLDVTWVNPKSVNVALSAIRHLCFAKLHSIWDSSLESEGCTYNKFDKLELASKHIWSTNTESTSLWRIVLARDFCVASDTWNGKHLHHLQRVCDKRATFVGWIVYFEHYANLKLIRLTLCCFYCWLVFLW